jgi:hypothetical protein
MVIQSVRSFMKSQFTPAQQERLIRYQGLHFRWFQHFLCRMFIGNSLRAIATFYHSDKWNGHWYAQHYEHHFRSLRKKPITLLEIGVGGEVDPELGGSSLRMWRTYFPNARIYGIDIFEKSCHNERRIKTFRGSQADEAFLKKTIDEIGSPDIIIDDGSHLNEHVIKTFQFLFPHLSSSGIYVVEDTQTSYWPKLGGSSEDFNRLDTTMGFLKSLIDGLNYEEFAGFNREGYRHPGYEETYFDKTITSMHFYHNLAFIYKGSNTENHQIYQRKN